MAKMKKPGILDILFTPHLTQAEFNFQTLWAPPLYSMLTFQDVEQLKAIASSIRYNANINKKYELIDKIMKNRGFRKFAGGTNRIVYACEENQNILLKIAIDRVGMGDNPAEYINQWTLQPYVCKCFEVSQCGTVGLFERLIPITHIEEFANIANDVFDIIVYKWLGKYVLDDIGTKYFMNWAIRKGFGPCLIDFPYLYRLDSNKLYCNKELQFGTGIICGGEIDYDAGFNDLVCTRCGKRYIANQLEDHRIENQIILKGGSKMKVGFYNEKGELITNGTSADHISIESAKKSNKPIGFKRVKAVISEVDIPDEIQKDPFKGLIPEVVNSEEEQYDEVPETHVVESEPEKNEEVILPPEDFNGDDEKYPEVSAESVSIPQEVIDAMKTVTNAIGNVLKDIPDEKIIEELDKINEEYSSLNKPDQINKEESALSEIASVLAKNLADDTDKKIIDELKEQKQIEQPQAVDEEYIIPGIGIGSKFISNKLNNRPKNIERDSGGRRFKKQFVEDQMYEEESTTSKSKKKKGKGKSKLENF